MPALAETALDALGNPVRRRIVRILASGPKPVGAIAAQLPVSRPAVSKHLRLLRTARLVTYEKLGNRNMFRLELSGFESAREWLDSFWDNALARFALLAENTTPALLNESDRKQDVPTGDGK